MYIVIRNRYCVVAITSITNPCITDGCRIRELRALHRFEVTPTEVVWSTITFPRQTRLGRRPVEYVWKKITEGEQDKDDIVNIVQFI